VRWWWWILIGILMLAAASVTLHYISGGRPGRAARHVARAEEYRTHGDFVHAIVELQTAAEIMPTDGHIRFLLGRVNEQNSNFSEALGHYEVAIGANPRDAEARSALARLLVFGGRLDEALTSIGKGVDLDPENPHLRALRGEIQMRRGDLPAALTDVTAAAQRAPTDEYVASMLASVRQQQGDSAGAINAIRDALVAHPNSADLRAILADLFEFGDRREEALSQVRQMVQIQPKSLPFRKRLARLLLLLDRPADAEKALRDAVTEVATDEARSELITFTLQRQGPEAAIREARAMVTANRADATLQVGLGRYLLDNGMAEEAERIFEDVLARFPDRVATVPAQTALAGLRLSEGKVAEAQQLSDAVLQRDPRNSEALMVRARLARGRGDPQGAISDLRTVLRANPESVPALRELVQAYAATGDAALAEESVRRALDASPDDIALRLTLAQILLSGHREAEALTLLHKLVQDDPKSFEAQEGIFRAALALQRVDEARIAAMTEQQLAPDKPVGYFRLATLEQSLGRWNEAEAALQQALNRNDGRGEPLAAMIRLLVQRGQAARALAMVDAAILRVPGDAELNVFRGDILTANPSLGDPIIEYRRAIDKAPNWAAGYRSLAAAQMARKDAHAALATLQAGASKLKTEEAEAVLSDLAGLTESMGRHEEAIAAYERALQLAPGNPVYQNNLALLLINYRNDADSLRKADTFAEQLSGLNAPALLDTRGWVKYKTGSSAAAAAILQQAVDALPEEPSIRYHLAVVQNSLGDHSGARENLTKALAVSRPFADRAAAEALLQQVKTFRRPR
jgi:tetratricopeptide (TPR) repeat protein